jgi:hypothetical protein
MADRYQQHYETMDLIMREIFASATTVDDAGDTTVYTPVAGASVLLQYLSLSADGANAGDVTVIVKLGALVKYKVSLKPGAIWARNIGAGRRMVRGIVDAPLIINLSAAEAVHVSVECDEG